MIIYYAIKLTVNGIIKTLVLHAFNKYYIYPIVFTVNYPIDQHSKIHFQLFLKILEVQP